MLLIIEIFGWLIICFELVGKSEHLEKFADRLHIALSEFAVWITELVFDDADNFWWKVPVFGGIIFLVLHFLDLMPPYADAVLKYFQSLGWIDSQRKIIFIASLFFIAHILLPVWLVVLAMRKHPAGTLSGLGVCMALTNSILSRV